MELQGFIVLCLAVTATVGRTITEDQASEIVHWHNLARSEIATQGICANMLEMEFDWTVGYVGMDYTEACGAVLDGHNDNRNAEYAALGGTGSLGENWAAGGSSCTDPAGGHCPEAGICGVTGGPPCDCGTYCSFKSGIYDRWYLSETVNPAAPGATNCKTFNEGGGHCTQVTWQGSYKVGCGWKNCNAGYGFYMTCNYSPAGNFNINSQPTVNGGCVSGPACSQCPTTHPYCTTGATPGLCSRIPNGGANSPPPPGTTTTTGTTTGTPTTTADGGGDVLDGTNEAEDGEQGSSSGSDGDGASAGTVAVLVLVPFFIILLAAVGAFIVMRRNTGQGASYTKASTTIPREPATTTGPPPPPRGGGGAVSHNRGPPAPSAVAAPPPRRAPPRSAAPPPRAAPFRPGDRVNALYPGDGQTYPGKFVRKLGPTSAVIVFDGYADEETVDMSTVTKA